MAAGIILPFITGQIRDIGNMFLPMHLPVFLCGLTIGAPYGFIVGLILPIFRSIVCGMPVLFPKAVGMSFELATYGFISGFIYSRSKHQCIIALYKSLIISMLFGRVVWGIVSILLYGMSGAKFTLAIFMAYAFINAIPGIIIQLTVIPAIMLMLDKTHLVKFKKTKISKTMTMILCFMLIGCSVKNESVVENEKANEEIIVDVPINKDLPVVYITIDDGPSEYTDMFLSLFDKYNAKVTYFCTNNSKDIRERIKKIYDKGHTLGVHSYLHDAKKIYQSVEAYYKDLYAEEEVLKESAGIYTKYLRLPYGSSNTLSNFNPGIISKITDTLKNDGFVYFDWNVSAEEKCLDENGKLVPRKAFLFAKKQIEDIVNYKKTSTIMILVHDTHIESYEYMKLLVKYLHDNGFEMRGINEETIPVHHTIYN